MPLLIVFLCLVALMCGYNRWRDQRNIYLEWQEKYGDTDAR